MIKRIIRYDPPPPLLDHMIFEQLEFFGATRKKNPSPCGVEVSQYLHKPSFAEADAVNY